VPTCTGSATADAALQRVHDWQRRFQGAAGVGRGCGMDAACGCEGDEAAAAAPPPPGRAVPPLLPALPGRAADAAAAAPPPPAACARRAGAGCCGPPGKVGSPVSSQAAALPAASTPERLLLSPRSMGPKPPLAAAAAGAPPAAGGPTPKGAAAAAAAKGAAPPPAPADGAPPTCYGSLGSNGSASNQDTGTGGFVSPSLRLDLADIRLLRQLYQKHVPAGRASLSQAEALDLVMDLLAELNNVPAAAEVVPHGLGSVETEMTAVNCELAFIFELFDQDNTDQISLQQLVAGCAILSSHTCSDRLAHVFHYCDSSRSGRLQAADLARAVRAMCLTRVARGAAHSQKVSLASFPDLEELTGGEPRPPAAAPAAARGGVDGAKAAVLRRRDSAIARRLTSAVVARASRHVDEDNLMRLGAFKSWAATDEAVCNWVRMPGSRTKALLSAVRKLREHLAYVEELRSLGFDELTISMTTNTAASASVTSSLCSVASVAVDGVPSVSATPGSSTTALAAKAPSAESPSGTPIPRRCDSDDTSSPFEIDFASLQLETRIGEGSYADVWKGRWLDSPVAIKVLKTRFNGTAAPAVHRQTPDVAAAHATGGGWASISSSAGCSRPVAAAAAPQVGFDGCCNGGGGCDVPRVGVSQRFLSEVQLLSTLRHPNVLLYMGACVRPSLPLCIVSELVEGGSLHQILHAPLASAGAKKAALTKPVRQYFSPNERVKLALDIARGMLYLHSSRPPLLHRDLKASNILIDTAVSSGVLCSRAIICDFGLSRLETMPTQREASEQASLVGTVATMAPEVISGDRYTAAADVYSFGIVIWELFSGLLPFSGMNPAQVMFSVTARDLRPPIKPGMMPPEVASLIQRCWRPQPSARPSFLEIVQVIGAVCNAMEIKH